MVLSIPDTQLASILSPFVSPPPDMDLISLRWAMSQISICLVWEFAWASRLPLTSILVIWKARRDNLTSKTQRNEMGKEKRVEKRQKRARQKKEREESKKRNKKRKEEKKENDTRVLGIQIENLNSRMTCNCNL